MHKIQEMCTECGKIEFHEPAWVCDDCKSSASPAGYGEWVSVDDRLPDEGEDVIMCHYYDVDGLFMWIASGQFEEGKWWCDFTDDEFKNTNFHSVTHWMPQTFNAP